MFQCYKQVFNKRSLWIYHYHISVRIGMKDKETVDKLFLIWHIICDNIIDNSGIEIKYSTHRIFILKIVYFILTYVKFTQT